MAQALPSWRMLGRPSPTARPWSHPSPVSVLSLLSRAPIVRAQAAKGGVAPWLSQACEVPVVPQSAWKPQGQSALVAPRGLAPGAVSAKPKRQGVMTRWR